MLFPTSELVTRLVQAERAVVVDWVGAMAALPGNPLGAEVIEVGNATACVCAGIPAEIWNRVFGLTEAEQERIPEIARIYRERGAAPLFDLAPHGIRPYYEGTNALAALAQHGFYQAAFHQLLYGRPEPGPAPEAAGVEVRAVGPEAADAFSRVYETVWGSGAASAAEDAARRAREGSPAGRGAGAIRVLLGHPRFRCYLAYVDGEPAALGVLHVHERAASMANGLTDPRFRNRGCQTALLHRRIADARRARLRPAGQPVPARQPERAQPDQGRLRDRGHEGVVGRAALSQLR